MQHFGTAYVLMPSHFFAFFILQNHREMDLFIFFIYSSSSTRDVFPIYGRAPAPPQGYGARREPTPPPSDTVGDASPEAGRHRGSNPGPPDHRTDALPTAPLEPPNAPGFSK